uniref:Uncharacterized protein n=1 Tax=Arundo donax TaxID=35708 RepID=A0A0A9H607_ARUDO
MEELMNVKEHELKHAVHAGTCSQKLTGGSRNLTILRTNYNCRCSQIVE